MSRDSEWLASLKAGDEVLVSGLYEGRLATVERVTATQVVIDNARRFRRTSGLLVGGSSWSMTSIREPTQADRDALEMRELRAEVEAYAKSKAATLDTLRAMRACMNLAP